MMFELMIPYYLAMALGVDMDANPQFVRNTDSATVTAQGSASVIIGDGVQIGEGVVVGGEMAGTDTNSDTA
jgi:hypothetical protein